ncbi:MAG: sugar phosphate isomerase/epimerase [Firmicutes bacterium]|nr:sugar phosphate isomerase/epimerase [[Eubacterium] siraeum]MCM1489045.1 sugar phosphate isomerase/epimerase [Bacillota bacterium]
MQIGASTACLYPMETEKAIIQLSDAGIGSMEIFFNADCELQGDIYAEIEKIVRQRGISVLSVHPYTSAIETMCLFGDYKRRLEAILDTYKRYFEIMNRLGAGVFVLHGALKSAVLTAELYFERYSMLYELGRSFGVTVAQENVSYCKSGSLDFLIDMKKRLGDNCGFVLDVKQALRSRLSPFEIYESLKESVVHCHLSDHDSQKDCIPVGTGSFDFEKFAQMLKESGYKGNIILELYRSGFEKTEELCRSVEYMKKFFRNDMKNKE